MTPLQYKSKGYSLKSRDGALRMALHLTQIVIRRFHFSDLDVGRSYRYKQHVVVSFLETMHTHTQNTERRLLFGDARRFSLRVSVSLCAVITRLEVV